MLFVFFTCHHDDSTTAWLIPSFMIISQLGWIDTLQAVIVPAMVSAFGVFWMRQYISSAIPDELLEAARMDGCSTFRTYWNIVLPTVKPGLATLGIVTFMNTWNDFFMAPCRIKGPECSHHPDCLTDIKRCVLYRLFDDSGRDVYGHCSYLNCLSLI